MLDHLVYAVPHLALGMRALADRLGTEPAPGGRHPDWGTANALASLGDGRYLEVIGPDPDGPSPATARPFGIDALDRPRLVTWAVQVTDIDDVVRAARAAGYDPGPIIDMSRTRPTGDRLTWRLTMTPAGDPLPGNGIVPFLIDWGASAHPSASLDHPCRLVELHAVHPDPDSVRPLLDAVGVELRVEHGEASGLCATLETPAGRVDLS